MDRNLNFVALISAAAVLTTVQPASADEADENEPDLIQLYGFLRLDAIFNDSRMSNVQTPEWVELEADGDPDDDAEFSIHPRLTRLGVDVGPKRVAGLNASGKIEIDFQNGGSESRSRIRLREAYMELQHDVFELLAGQAWDLASPLRPSTNGDTHMWNTGNLGDRRPQLRGTLVLPAAGGALRIAAMAGQTGAIDNKDLDNDGRLDGIEAGAPTVQGLGEFIRSGIRLGIWGHGGFEAVSTPIGDVDGFASWVVGGHVVIPFQERLWVKGELHRGRNLSDIRGGIGQGINVATAQGIRSTGGWAEIGARIRKPYTIAVGVFVENPDDGDLEDGERELNWAYSITQHIRPHERLTVGVEYLFWKTDYKNIGSGTANRGNVFVKLDF